MPTPRSWIYDFDRLVFEPYEDGRSAESLAHHTRHGEIIVHRGESGALSVITKEAVTAWPEGHSYDVFQYAWQPGDFA